MISFNFNKISNFSYLINNKLPRFVILLNFLFLCNCNNYPIESEDIDYDKDVESDLKPKQLEQSSLDTANYNEVEKKVNKNEMKSIVSKENLNNSNIPKLATNNKNDYLLNLQNDLKKLFEEYDSQTITSSSAGNNEKYQANKNNNQIGLYKNSNANGSMTINKSRDNKIIQNQSGSLITNRSKNINFDNSNIDLIDNQKYKLNLFNESNININEGQEKDGKFTQKSFLKFFKNTIKNKKKLKKNNLLVVRFCEFWERIFSDDEILKIDADFLELVHKCIEKLLLIQNSNQIKNINIEYISNLITLTFKYLHKEYYEEREVLEIKNNLEFVHKEFFKEFEGQFKHIYELIKRPKLFVEICLRYNKKYLNISMQDNQTKINSLYELCKYINHSLISLYFSKSLVETFPSCFEKNQYKVILNCISILNKIIDQNLKTLKKNKFYDKINVSNVNPSIILSLKINKFYNKSIELKYLNFKKRFKSFFTKQ